MIGTLAARATACLALVAVSFSFWAQDALGSTANIDSLVSSVNFEGNVGGLPVVPQIPGSLQSTLSGTVQVNLLNGGTFIEILPGSQIAMSVHPGSFTPNSSNVNLAGQVTDEQINVTIYALYADVTIDVQLGPTPINPDGTFNAEGLLIVPLSGTLSYFLPPSSAGTRDVTGPLASFGDDLIGHVNQLGGGKFEIVVPFRISNPDFGFDNSLTGTVRAVVPEPSSYALAAIGAGALLAVRQLKRRK